MSAVQQQPALPVSPAAAPLVPSQPSSPKSGTPKAAPKTASTDTSKDDKDGKDDKDDKDGKDDKKKNKHHYKSIIFILIVLFIMVFYVFVRSGNNSASQGNDDEQEPDAIEGEKRGKTPLSTIIAGILGFLIVLGISIYRYNTKKFKPKEEIRADFEARRVEEDSGRRQDGTEEEHGAISFRQGMFV